MFIIICRVIFIIIGVLCYMLLDNKFNVTKKLISILNIYKRYQLYILSSAIFIGYFVLLFMFVTHFNIYPRTYTYAIPRGLCLGFVLGLVNSIVSQNKNLEH